MTDRSAPASLAAPDFRRVGDRSSPLEVAEDAGLSIKRLPRQRMRRRFWRLVGVALAAQALVSAGTLVALQGGWRSRARHDHAGALAAHLATQLAQQRTHRLNPLSQRLLDDAIALDGVHAAAVVDASGRAVASAGPADELATPIEALTRATPQAGVSAPGRMLRVTPIATRGDEPRWLALDVADRSAGRALLDGGVALGAGLLVAVLVALPIVHVRFLSWTRGLHRLHAAIRRAALDAPLCPAPVTGHDEIAYLSLAYNEMAARINTSRRALLDANELLERRVADRTEELGVANDALERQNVKLAELTETALRFTDDVAHEFRTPLAVIMEFAAIMSDGIGGELNEEQLGYLRFVHDASGDLARLVDDFLDSSKLRARSLRVERREHGVVELLDELWPMLETRAAVASVTLERDIAADVPRVCVDAEKARRALLNLATNAFKFSGAGSTVTVRASVISSGVPHIAVIDQGPGLTPEEVATLFERFGQTTSGRQTAAKGFGLGLNIVRELVAINLGEVTIESEPGKGSSFGFTMPSSEAESIVAMALRPIVRRSPRAPIGVLVARPRGGAELETLGAALASATYPTDVQLVSAARDAIVLFGETESVHSWRDRVSGLVCSDGVTLMSIEGAETHAATEADGVILERVREPRTCAHESAVAA